MIRVTAYTYNYTRVIEFHNTADADSDYVYGTSADSDIGIGVKLGSSWSMSGTSHVGNTNSAEVGQFVTTHFGNYIGTQFKYQHGYFEHNIPQDCPYVLKPFVRAVQWSGGLAYMGDVSQYDCLDLPQFNWKQKYEIGQWFRTSGTRAYRFSVAADISTQWGTVSVSATSGYSAYVRLHWQAARVWIYLCGNNAYPPQAQIIYAY
jgi:hypothetical protein